MMKKILAAMLAGLLAVSLISCSAAGNDSEAQETEAESEEVVTVGGMTLSDSPAVTGEVEDLVSQAASALENETVIPVALVGTQVVAGENDLVLCRIQYSDGSPDAYGLLTIYQDLDGNAELTALQLCEAGEDTSDLDGGWTMDGDPTVEDEAAEALANAENGSDYIPVAELGTQVVAGENYRLLCAVQNGDDQEYRIITLYRDLDGNGEITDTLSFQETELN